VRAALACAIVLLCASAARADSRGATPVPIADADGKPLFLYEESHALIVGVSRYDHRRQLKGVPDDVRAVKAALEAQSFDVEVVQDPTYRQLDEALRDFANRKGGSKNTRLLFYFAGHGETVQVGGPDAPKRGFFLPRDADKPSTAGRAPLNALPMYYLEAFAKTQLAAKHVLFVFDSCFAGSIFRGEPGSSPPPAITKLADRPVREFITSGTEDQEVPDESKFRREFVAALSGDADANHDGYVTGTELGMYLKDRVANISEGKQTPSYGFINDSYYTNNADFVFALPGSSRVLGGARSEARVSKNEYETAEDGVHLLRRALQRRSIADIERAAAKGSGEDLYLLGIAKWEGIGVPVDLPGARQLLQQAMFANFKRAAMAYGSMLFEGVGGPKNVEEAVSWWRIGAEAGHAPSLARLAVYYAFDAPKEERSFAKARPYFEKAAALGHLGAKARLGDYAWYGYGQPIDKPAALKIYEQAAAEGSTLAMRQIADAYRFGPYPVDKPRARDVLVKAAALGDDLAAITAAEMSRDGEGVDRDLAQATRLLAQAADAGEWHATALLAQMLANGQIDPVPGRNAEAMAVAADEHGYPEGLLDLTQNLREGKHGARVDLKHAGELARPALERARKRPLDDEAGYPMYAHSFAQTVRAAMAAGLIKEAHPGESAELEREYGKLGKNMRRFTASVDCGGIQSPFYIYTWDAPDGPVPTEAQFEWLDKARGCQGPSIRESFKKLFALAKTNNVSFSDLSYTWVNGKEPPDPKKQPPDPKAAAPVAKP
jgi:TPR repeat protein